MQSVNFEIGNYKEYALNNDEKNTIKIDVSDIGLIDRLQTAMNEIAEYQKTFDEVTDPDERIIKEMDETARKIVNKAFDEDICTKAFGNKNCFSVASNGKLNIVNFLEGFIPVIQNDFQSALQAQQIQLEEKTDKYTKPVTGMVSKPAIDVSELTQEQKNAILRELLK